MQSIDLILLGKENECSGGKSFELRDHTPMITDAIADDQPGVCFNEPSPLQPINATKLDNVIKGLPSDSSCPTTSSRDTASLDTSLYTSR